ncbi:FapA family protein [Paenibacillus eucommiae]|uniref:Uncharacterized protein (DUF342 family) n=1 Tax=Paenibacillus eucommiae TaxID=1355755 RepID=A0ABS4J170_9BACL|nr:FapA family protein [Paenibacillus eucommiae]MBP1993538.1 uncharacterized protein (DUF342 family) [Paenibacillus eucommiae]
MSNHVSESDLLKMIKSIDSSSSPSNLQDEHGPELQDLQGAEHIEGWIRVDNNRILFGGSFQSGLRCVIAAEAPLQLTVNGKLVNGETKVGPNDIIDWQVKPGPLFEVRISEDQMEVSFRVISTERYGWKLRDHEPTQKIILKAQEDRTALVEKLRLSDVMKDLLKLNVTKNVNTPAIFTEIQNPSYTFIQIAHGINSIESMDARIEVFFQENIESILEEVNGAIDYRNHLKIPMAKKGDVIAKKHPAVPGTIGYNVFGQIIQPAPPRDITMVAKENIEITAEGEVIAQQSGRPRMTGAAVKYFDITKAHVVHGDVDIKTGNIVFSGDIIVYGNVTEGMIVESLGNVYVTGHVYQSQITATGSILIKGNVSGSYLYSGYFGVLFNRLYVHSKKLIELLYELLKAADILIHLITAKRKTFQYHQIIMTLLETKYREVRTIAKEIINSINSIQNLSSTELTELKEKLQLLTQPAQTLEIGTSNPIKTIIYHLEETFSMIERMQEIDACIDINTCHLTEMKSNGSTIIRGEGMLQSNVYAKGSIVFIEKDSVCRGCQLESEESISVSVAGGEIANETHMKAGKSVMLGRMIAGKIQVGKSSVDILEPISDVVVTEQSGRLVFTKTG